MVVWSGRGYLSLLVLIVLLFTCVWIFPDKESEYCFIIALFGASWFSWIYGNRWNNKLTRIFIDKETGKEIALKERHTLFWIKMEYWGIIFMAFGLIILAQNLSKDGIYLAVNIFLALVGATSLTIFVTHMVRMNAKVDVEIEKADKIVPKSNYSQIFEEKEKAMQSILEKKDEDLSRYMPK